MKASAASSAAHVSSACASLRTKNGEFRCPLCPSRSFNRIARVVQHLQRYHTSTRRYTPSGRKQIRVLKALRDDDLLAKKSRCDRYLERSASILAEGMQKQAGGRHLLVDNDVRICLDFAGPKAARKRVGGGKQIPPQVRAPPGARTLAQPAGVRAPGGHTLAQKAGVCARRGPAHLAKRRVCAPRGGAHLPQKRVCAPGAWVRK